MRYLTTRYAFLAAAGLGLLQVAAAGESEKSAALPPPATRDIDFVKDVAPIFEERCNHCHGEFAAEGQLRLDAKAIVFSGGMSGPSLKSGDSKHSLIVRRIAGLDDQEAMPFEDERLSNEQIGIIRKWIDDGAKWPGGFGSDATTVEKHWAYVKPERPDVPEVEQKAWPRNAIDNFVLARLEAKGLSPSPEAEKERLLRRVTLDLTGVPPTIDEIDAFLSDDSPNAYEQVVERLLASPKYGERWAVPWLDAARFADSNGYQRDGRREAWAYRDWVIRAFNADMPYDQFVTEQLAGDLLPDATRDQIIATGFHRNTMANVEAGTDPDEEYFNATVDRVNTTGTVFLGTTLECAQCHNHKYDPISQEDYYGLYAIFDNTAPEIKRHEQSRREFTGPKMNLPLTDKQRAAKTRWSKLLDEADAAMRQCLIDLPEEMKQREFVPAVAQRPEFFEMKAKRDRAAKKLDEIEPHTVLVMKELPEDRPTRMFKRGDFTNPGRLVEPHVPRVMHDWPEGEPRNRLGLAKWMTDPENPLLARVTVNRQWAELFGRGIVPTLVDFGVQAESPTHPELLDWLAIEFMQEGWSLKRLHKLMVTSATYRQSARVTPELLEIDPYNEIYSHGPRSRLPAEFVRDNALAVAGLLSDKMHGPPVFPYQPKGVWNHTGVASNEWQTSTGEDQYRRGVYVYWRRTVPYPSFVNFDAPSREVCSLERSNSNTPLQALTLMNDPVYIEAAAGLARRILTEVDGNNSDRIIRGFRLATSRRPSEPELRILTRRLDSAVEQFSKDPAAARQLAKKHERPENVSVDTFAAWTTVASILLNLDESISR
ncbi:PSD1 and planctomycete cytochrome C domain-containing protein [Stratiformator vulcanicus]|uniref:Planctomycete cytochrome C n=1 Tax=Stratiformator vulcanicus TaxID=2527980 RepID=A0A517QXZ1_9PLAN|nr:PSD1 and planctomycete cytochrome C domain-containing protein [Stratiformator vulcanicus]QDT36477.1 Planctomycete cytochrome C [Stratiformator vulcanicus]